MLKNNTMAKKIIAIIGFGFCGRLAFFHLAKKADKNTKILIFDKNGPNTLGPAFSSFSPFYILNVPAIKMSPFSDEPRKFCEFLEKKYPQILSEIGENGFAPREIYGKYIEELTIEAFENAKKNSLEVEFISEEVVKISDEFLVEVKSGKSFEANEIVLATSFKQSEFFFPIDVKNLWNQDALQFHQKKFTDEKICLIGSGLTAVDVIVGLKNKNFGGKIFVISRRGNFPKKHFSQNQKNPDFLSVEDAKKGVLFLCLKIRQFLRANPQFDLRHVIDSIRHETTNFWQNFDEKNKKLFLRLLPYWNIFRHRAPISSIELIEQMIESGQIEVKKKGVKNISEKIVEVQGEKLQCDVIVNCLGFEFRSEKYPLLDQMIKADLLKKDLLLAQSSHPKIHLLGGLNIGRDFECTAVPDLRVSVENYLNSRA